MHVRMNMCVCEFVCMHIMYCIIHTSCPHFSSEKASLNNKFRAKVSQCSDLSASELKYTF